jgi:hypothetical protein
MAKKTSKRAKVKPIKQEEQSLNNTGPRVVRPGKYNSFRLQKKLKTYRPPLAGSFRILFRSIKLLFSDWKLFGGIIVIYLLLELMLVQGLSLITSGGTLSNTKSLIQGASNLASTSASLFLLLVGNGTGNSSSSAYQFILLLLVSLVLIWALRQKYLGAHVRIRDAFYQGVEPLVRFFLVLLTIGIELVPGVIGIILYTAVANNGIAATFVERMLWVLLVGMLVLWSCYYVTATIFALYIITLNGMTPVRALRMASRLVKGRRIIVMTKVLFVPIAIFFIMGILIVPFLLFAVKIAPGAFFVVTALMVALLHAYLYSLYRELLNE